jgi:hypothetical protein
MDAEGQKDSLYNHYHKQHKLDSLVNIVSLKPAIMLLGDGTEKSGHSIV